MDLTGTGSQIKTVSITTNVSGGTMQHIIMFINQQHSNGKGAVFNVTISGGQVTSVTIYNGGTGYCSYNYDNFSIGNGQFNS